jgi:hypothetical protein
VGPRPLPRGMEGLTDMEDVLTVVDVKDIALCGGRRPEDDVEAPKSAATKGAEAAVLPTSECTSRITR